MKDYKKHELNYLPEITGDDYESLKESIKQHGYDKSQPIYLYEGKVIDGRNRQNICYELDIEPSYKEFVGTRLEALDYIRRTNLRRNLNSTQKAVAASDYAELHEMLSEEVEKERRKKQAETLKETLSKKENNSLGELIPPNSKRDEKKHEESKTRTKIAKQFDTNPRYVSDAKKIKKESPEDYEKMKLGKLTISKYNKKRKKEKEAEHLREQREKAREFTRELIVSKTESELNKGWHKIGGQYLYYGSNLNKEFIDFLPQAKFAFADPPYNAGVDDWDQDFKWQNDYLQDKAEVVAVTPGGWNAYNFYRNTEMNYIWEMACWIKNGMTHGRCGYANFIKTSIFGNTKPKIQQDFFEITIKTSETSHTKHKGRKPYDYMLHLLNMFTKEGDTIIDPFAGSGTTLLLSELNNRVSYNAELDKDFCLDIINRLIEKGCKYERL